MLQLLLFALLSLCALPATTLPTLIQQDGREVSQEVFDSLEELARVVDITYCVGMTGIQKPFQCLSRCSEFEGFELVKTWNTGPLLSDSCGYIALSHSPHKKRVIVAFRGTYSIANTIADLSTVPAEYAPFPADGGEEQCTLSETAHEEQTSILPQLLKHNRKPGEGSEKCTNCTVHSGFMTSWRNTRCTIIPEVEQALQQHPDYELTLVGHSLGGAVAALAALEFQARGWKPTVTTFGEPKIGNAELNTFIDHRFNLNATDANNALYRRVTHVDDPVPLLPPQEWGYRMHAGEIFISKSSLPPTRQDLEHCSGDEDAGCIASGEAVTAGSIPTDQTDSHEVHGMWGIPKKYHLWQLFFAHREYFWRLGLCVPSGYPWEWHGSGDHNGVIDNEL